MDSGSQSVVLVNSSTSHIIPATAVRVYHRERIILHAPQSRSVIDSQELAGTSRANTEL